jgi:hypothetical protein
LTDSCFKGDKVEFLDAQEKENIERLFMAKGDRALETPKFIMYNLISLIDRVDKLTGVGLSPAQLNYMFASPREVVKLFIEEVLAAV